MTDKTLLHELFDGEDTIGVLGHLLVTSGFDFTFDELAKINNIKPIRLNKILDNLIDFGMVKYLHGKYSYDNINTMSRHFERFFKHLLLWNLERFSNK